MSGGWAVAAAFLAGCAACMGLGGGMILMLWLTIFAGVPQLEAQGINLLFFLPVAVLSLVFHTKNQLVDWKRIPAAVLLGAAGAFGGVWLANYLGSEVLRKWFAAFLLLVGLKELLGGWKKKKSAVPRLRGKRFRAVKTV